MAEVRKIPILHILKFFIQHCVCQFCYIVSRAVDILEAPNDDAAVEFGLRRQASVLFKWRSYAYISVALRKLGQ
jgi:hypothetical protein